MTDPTDEPHYTCTRYCGPGCWVPQDLPDGYEMITDPDELEHITGIPHSRTVEDVIRLFHSDGDFVWTDVEVGVLVRALEDVSDFIYPFEQWAKHPTSGGATAQALMAAQRVRTVVTW